MSYQIWSTTTKISDIIVPTVFVPYVIARTAEKSNLIHSGIIVPDPQMDILAQAGGKLINMPFFNDLSGADEVLADNAWLTPGKIGTGQDIAPLLMRGKAWGVNDLSFALSGDDPMGAVANLVATYWMRREQQILISTLNGIFATTMATSHTKDISIPAGNSATDVNLIGATTVIDAATLLGDNADMLTAIAMHSVPYSRLQKLSLIEWEAASTGTTSTAWSATRVEAGLDDPMASKVPTFLGRRVIVDDGCPAVPGGTNGMVYTSYLFGPGSVARGEGKPHVPVETDRDSLAGEDYLIHRRHLILHPRGVKFTSNTVTGSTPTNTELATGANWLKVYTDKQIKIIALKTNG